MTPPYMLVMASFVYLYSYLGQGPMWPENIAVADKCRADWWKHLLYISNLVGVNGVPAEEQVSNSFDCHCFLYRELGPVDLG